VATGVVDRALGPVTFGGGNFGVKASGEEPGGFAGFVRSVNDHTFIPSQGVVAL